MRLWGPAQAGAQEERPVGGELVGGLGLYLQWVG